MQHKISCYLNSFSQLKLPKLMIQGLKHYTCTKCLGVNSNNSKFCIHRNLTKWFKIQVQVEIRILAKIYNDFLARNLRRIQNMVKLQSVLISTLTLKSGWFIGLIRFKMFMRRWHRFYYQISKWCSGCSVYRNVPKNVPSHHVV